jgi:N-[(2S)-2-amino-2-carboxyethyl]-L-glutamate dehydrogenase
VIAPEAGIQDPTPPGRLAVPPFAVIPGAQVRRALQGRHKEIIELVEATYRLHGVGDSVNPPSYFLRFADRPLRASSRCPPRSAGLPEWTV